MPSIVDNARALRPLLRASSAEIESGARLTPEVFNALSNMDAFRLQLSADYGGPAASPIDYLKVIEELSRGDASSGWCAMVGSESVACINAFLEPATVRKMLEAGPQSTAAFTVVGAGIANETADGYVASGRWRFASGCRHADWLASLCVVHDENGPRMRDNGAPLTRVIFVRREDSILHDTWTVSGLRGTASDDFEIRDLKIPRDRSFDLAAPAIDPGTGWRIPVVLRLAMSKAAAVCGIARGAMDALVPMLERKPFAGAVPAREEPRFQLMLAQAEGALEGGRAYLYQNIDIAWQTVLRGDPLTIDEIARVRLAIVLAAQRALESLHLMQEIAGTSAVLDPTFDRHARDFEVARHHMQLQTHVAEDVGRVLLGMQPRNPMF
ncbi:MAG: alkylation response protein AidB-like acyl-CoA dehydrogenase [Gammaproteobacteria bacterium]|jgi:alkylation response protein AidB-like acyl-CoA dehydrogenase